MGASKRLVVPFEAIRSFSDPSVHFSLTFSLGELATEAGMETTPSKIDEPGSGPDAGHESEDETAPDDEKAAPSDQTMSEVVQLDVFRKK